MAKRGDWSISIDIRVLGVGLFALLLGLCVVAELFLERKGYFGIDAWFGFPVWLTLCGLLLWLISALLATVLRRPEDYYDDHIQSTPDSDGDSA